MARIRTTAAFLAPFVLAFSSACETGCGAAGGGRGSEDARRLVVASWNLEAFFDAEETGTEYDEYKKSQGWTEAKYRARVDRMAAAVEEISEDGPDLIAVQEIENATTLEALAAGPFAAYGYRWTAFAREAGGSIGVGLLSRHPLSNIRVHSVGSPGTEAPRPILEARLTPGGASLAVFVCHWKSKLGGEKETEAQRRASAASLARRLAELAAADASMGALVLGDLNENVDEFQRTSGRYVTALLPDSSEAAEAVGACREDEKTVFSFGGPFLVVSATRPPASTLVPDAVPVFSPWFDAAWPGSYTYQNRWETIDHALLTASLFDGAGWEYGSFRVMDLPPFTDEEGCPDGYDPRTGTGLSDHLPIVVELERK